jgi:hypothetical protein
MSSRTRFWQRKCIKPSNLLHLTPFRANYSSARPMLVILHDPPEVLASPDPRTGRIELHNTWLVSQLYDICEAAD